MKHWISSSKTYSAALIRTVKKIHMESLPLEDNQEFQQLYADYLAKNPIYYKGHFRRRFRISRNVFITICDKVRHNYNYFVKKADCRGLKGFTAEQKVTAALRFLAYGCAADSVDE